MKSGSGRHTTTWGSGSGALGLVIQRSNRPCSTSCLSSSDRARATSSKKARATSSFGASAGRGAGKGRQMAHLWIGGQERRRALLHQQRHPGELALAVQHLLAGVLPQQPVEDLVQRRQRLIQVWKLLGHCRGPTRKACAADRQSDQTAVWPGFTVSPTCHHRIQGACARRCCVPISCMSAGRDGVGCPGYTNLRELKLLRGETQRSVFLCARRVGGAG